MLKVHESQSAANNMQYRQAHNIERYMQQQEIRRAANEFRHELDSCKAMLRDMKLSLDSWKREVDELAQTVSYEA